MPVPTHIFDPPFNIVRCSHAVLDVVDLNTSRAFYENAVGNRLGFKVGTEQDLDKAAAFLSESGITYSFADQPFQGRTMQFADPFGFQVELHASMDKRPHLLRRYDLYKGCHPQRLDHFNVFAAEVQDTIDFY